MLVIFLLFNVVKLRALQSSYTFYDNPELSISQVMTAYHTYINDTVNSYTSTMLAASLTDKRGNPPENSNNCPDDPQKNFSTYCLAVQLIGDDGKNFKGFINYKTALQNRRNKLADKDPLNPYAQGAVNMVDSLTAIRYFAIRQTNLDQEIDNAKKAIDTTLATYDELRILYPMHEEYVNIFNALVNYRDKLVEVRHETDQFPSRFIDVTTSKCT